MHYYLAINGRIRIMKRIVLLAVVLGAGFSLTAANAALITRTAVLNGSQEVPSNGSTAGGVATATVDTAAMSVAVHLSVTGISLADITFPSGPLAFGVIGPVHIHIGARGSNGGVAIPFGNMADYAATASGFDLSSTGGMVLPSFTFNQFLTAFAEGNTYFNVHTLNSPGGEIRGQVVPEPGTLGLLCLGLLGLCLARRKLA